MEANMANSDPVKVTLAGAISNQETEKFDPESEARKLLELMGASGILPPEMIRQLLGGQEIIDAEVVEIEEEEEEQSFAIEQKKE
jgi:hypothetical protein